MTATLADRLAAKTEPADNDCLLFTGARNSRGYGCIGVNGKSQLAHRVAYELHVGFLAKDITIDHLCCNKRCVNPNHLEPVSHAENRRRAAFGVNWPIEPEPDWLTLGEVEQRARMGQREVLAALRDGSLRGNQVKPGGKWRVHRADVDSWLHGDAPEPLRPSFTRRVAS